MSDNTAAALAEYVRIRRLRAGLTQETLAGLAGIEGVAETALALVMVRSGARSA